MSRLSYQSSLDFILKLERSGIKLGLNNTFDLLSSVGDPQRRFESIHIAGTNGKGSVACFLNSILFHNSLTTGLFTSPHLVDYRERIRKNGVAMSRGDMTEIVSDLAGHILRIGASYFEATTVLAFEYFKRHGVEIAAIEVGMGGRLDSTNVINPLTCCITSIDFDHEKYLGKTIAKIAKEKGGIIKKGVPVVCGIMSKRASRAIRDIAQHRGSRCYELGRDATVEPLRVDLDGAAFLYSGLSGRRVLKIRLPGFHQIFNAATAALSAEVLNQIGIMITDKAIEEGLENAFWPGRFQILRKRPLVICDAAHNVSATRVLSRSLREIGIRCDSTVFGVLRDKRYKTMLSLLSAHSGQFVFTKPLSPRALPLCRLKESGKELDLKFKGISTVKDAIADGLETCGRDGTLLVCGSLYTIGEAMQFFGFKPHLASVC